MPSKASTTRVTCTPGRPVRVMRSRSPPVMGVALTALAVKRSLPTATPPMRSAKSRWAAVERMPPRRRSARDVVVKPRRDHRRSTRPLPRTISVAPTRA
jgi:hypothetical protein